MAKPFIKVITDHTAQFMQIVRTLKDQEVLVGIPESNTARTDAKEKGQMTNAALLFINEHGSPINNIPPRPAMALGLSKAADDIADQFHEAAVHAFGGGQDAIDKYYSRAGIVASSAIKEVITDQMGITPLKASTIAARKSQGLGSEKALIATGQMRNAITWVLRNKSWLR